MTDDFLSYAPSDAERFALRLFEALERMKPPVPVTLGARRADAERDLKRERNPSIRKRIQSEIEALDTELAERRRIQTVPRRR